MYVYIFRRGSRYKSNCSVIVDSNSKSDSEAVSNVFSIMEDSDFDSDFIEIWDENDFGTLVCTLEL